MLLMLIAAVGLGAIWAPDRLRAAHAASGLPISTSSVPGPSGSHGYDSRDTATTTSAHTHVGQPRE